MALVPEYMRVRAYVINYIGSPERESDLIPPENELCRIFNVTRPTVRNAIRGLVEDGYLIPRRGLGTYINQEKFNQTRARWPIVGVVRGDGRNITSSVSHEIGKALSMNGLAYQPIYLSNSDDPARLIEILRNGVAALIWEEPIESHQKFMEAVKEAAIPQIIYDKDLVAGYDGIMRPTSIGEALADYLFDKGHERMLFVDSTPVSDYHSSPGSWLDRFCVRVTELSGERIRQRDCLCDKDAFQDRIKNMKIGRDNFSVIYTVADNLPGLSRILKRENVSVPEDLSLVTYREGEGAYFGLDSCCYVDTFTPWKKALFKWIDKRLINHNLSGVFQIEMDTIIQDGETLNINPALATLSAAR